MAIDTLDDPFAGTKRPEDEMPMDKLPVAEVGGGASMPALSDPDASIAKAKEVGALPNQAPIDATLNKAHAAGAIPGALVPAAQGVPAGLQPPVPPNLARSAEQAVATGTVVPGRIETDSVTTTTKSPTTTGKVETESAKKANRDLEFQKQRIADATKTQMDAEATIDRIALDAEGKRNAILAENDAKEAAARQAAEDRRIASETAADKELADADAKVKEKQDAAINWNKGKTPFKILNTILRAAAMKDAYIMNPKGDPSDNPVAKTIDAALAEEKEVKQREFLASKEWRDALKTKNAELIKRTYDRETAKINMEVTARARALIHSEKADQLATRTAKLDPNGDYYNAAKELADAKLKADDARDRQTYAMNWAPTVESGGTVTTTVKKVTEGSNGPGGGPLGKPAPAATTEDVEKWSKLEQAAKDRRELAEMLGKESNSKSWENLKEADKQHRREDAFNISIPGLGVNVGLGQVARGLGSVMPHYSDITGSKVARPGLDVTDKLRSDKDAQELWRRLERITTQTAKGYGGAITANDSTRAQAELGVQGKDAASMREALLKQADEYDKQAAEMRRQRSVR